MSGEARLRAYRSSIDQRLAEILPKESQAPEALHRAMRYAVLGDGKRIRPALAMASALAAGGTEAQGLEVGCAVELVHCFSLIHDDLPAIDNDDLRRGRLTVHKAFAESVAVLAGDALFALAFEVLASSCLSDSAKARANAVLSQAVGSQGLVGGEMLDVLSEGEPPKIETVRRIHLMKTASLISASCELGALAAGSGATVQSALGTFGRHLGLAFQIIDDVLNETSAQETLGKAAGSDRDRLKMTYPACLSIEDSLDEANGELAAALRQLEDVPGDTAPVRDLADYCVARDR
ncbi:MAG: polyprenyl synthetase family protein [Armatimonadetes bacterium]|nr:polyprenyl synthetase family protein [Armatimonadota bacterium]